MKCPHCLEGFFDEPVVMNIGADADSIMWAIVVRTCPSCEKFILHLRHAHPNKITFDENLIRPKSISRSPIPKEVPSEYVDDYIEACLVLPDSPKASAALSRRCLQHILRTKGVVKKGDLSNEIQQVIDSNKLPSHIAEDIDAIRNIGNFATHPIKSTSTGEIVDVEPGEAEWNLDVLELLFDFYFVQPEKSRLKREALNKKLTGAGKPEMK